MLRLEFTHRRATKFLKNGDEAFNIQKYDEAISAYGTVLSLDPPTPNSILIKWASMTLIHGSASEALSAAAKVHRTRRYRTRH